MTQSSHEQYPGIPTLSLNEQMAQVLFACRVADGLGVSPNFPTLVKECPDVTPKMLDGILRDESVGLTSDPESVTDTTINFARHYDLAAQAEQDSAAEAESVGLPYLPKEPIFRDQSPVAASRIEYQRWPFMITEHSDDLLANGGYTANITAVMRETLKSTKEEASTPMKNKALIPRFYQSGRAWLRRVGH